jgi:hypothetical protein
MPVSTIVLLVTLRVILGHNRAHESDDLLPPTIGCIVLFLIQCVWVWWVRSRIPFASVILSFTMDIIRKYKVILVFGYVGCVAQIGLGGLCRGIYCDFVYTL